MIRLPAKALRLARELAVRSGQAAALDANDWKLLGRTWIAVAGSRMALWVLPCRRLGMSINTSAETASVRPSPNRLEWAVRVVSHAVPCATCLTQALALQRLLARHGYVAIVQVGACNVDRRFLAHAWVEHEGQSLLGTSEDVARYARFFTWPESQLDYLGVPGERPALAPSGRPVLRRGKAGPKTTRASAAKRATRTERAGEAAGERACSYCVRCQAVGAVGIECHGV